MAKRKAAELASNDPYDPNEIQVAATSSPRKVLCNVSVPNAQNKRRRLLKCVLIPPYRQARKLPADQQCLTARPRVHYSTQPSITDESDSDDVEVAASQAPADSSPEPKHDSRQTSAAQTSTKARETTAGLGDLAKKQSPDETDRGRQRRSRPWVSYVSMIGLDDDSADELVHAEPAFGSSRKPPKRRASLSSEYDEDVTAVAVDIEDDYQSSSSASDESDDIEEEEDSEDDVKTTARRRPTAQPHSENSVAQSDLDGTEPKRMSKEMKNLITTKKGLDLDLPPLHEIEDIFQDLTSRALPLGLDEAVKSLQKTRLRVATMCSGTESPLLAIEMIQDTLRTSFGIIFDIEHLFSAEIEPYKQAYIERNFSPPIIFEDIRELVEVANDSNREAKTAYSGMKKVPTDVDMVIAGTSCVDFSGMNKHRKGIHEGGESGDTWYAVLAYCKAYRPAIVVLENVRTARWDRMLQDYKTAGYEPAGAYVDTKDYYLPQTRQRGYMVCFDKSRLQKAGIRSASEDWKTSMEKLRRRASSPVSSFLLPACQTAARPLQVNESLREVDWSKCEITQMNTRLKEGLGVARPITQWSENGEVLPPDHGSRAWHSAQVERVLDTLDAATLRKAHEGFDARFKTRAWDLSQNLHRISDRTPFGLIGCITPTGINFVSDSWRAMTAQECLTLQGIPLKKISFTVETNAEIQSLAGNAMSAPLVGAAIVSSLIAGHRMFDSPPQRAVEKQLQQQQIHATQLCKTSTTQVAPGEANRKPVDIVSLLENVERALRRCYCEGGHGSTKQPIQKCIECGHTTCISCGGNPTHKYRQSQHLTFGRIPFATFEQSLRSELPLQLTFPNGPTWSPETSAVSYYDCVRPLTSTTFSLSSIRRTHHITVAYTAPGGRLELCLRGGRATWYLYATAPVDLASNAALRVSLTYPVARAEVEQSLLENRWEWRRPSEGNTQCTITGRGERLPAWRARMHIPNFRDEWQWQFLEIHTSAAGLREEINGTYQFFPQCGTANESLYKRVKPQGGRPVFLFLDPTRVGPADEDCFVFAYDFSRLDYDETRHYSTRVNAKWRPWSLNAKGDRHRQDTTVHFWEWSSPADTKLTSVHTNVVLHRPTDFAITTEHLSCRQAIIAAKASSINVSPSTASQKAEDDLVSLDDQCFFASNSWIFEAMRRQLPTDEWIKMTLPTDVRCHDCAPEKPMLKWELAEKGAIKAYEDPHAAAIYEKAIKRQQSPILVQADRDSLTLGINIVSLAHRAQSRLRLTEAPIENQWRLLTTTQSTDASLRRFHLQPTEDVQPCDADVSMSVKLFPKQCLALAWMQNQEVGKMVLLEEAEEATIPNLGWVVEMRAQTMQRVKGGICADHPGFGKTITSLALIHTEWLQYGTLAIRTSVAESRARDAANALLISSATIVVCPKLLIEQWYLEACEKWDSEDDICKITRANDLAKYTIDDFTTAKLILVTRQAIASASYADRLAAFVGVPGPAQDKGRANMAWARFAAEQVPEHLQVLEDCNKQELVAYLKKKHTKNTNSETLVRDVPSKRMRGREYMDAKAGKTAPLKTSKAPSEQLRTELVGGPLFEMFVFNRVIVDEFHECDAKELQMISALKADKRWGLSGTPALSDCYDLAQIGKLLNVPLRIGSIQKGFMKQGNIKNLHTQMTSFEKFEAARSAPSNSQNGRIQELAQEFLDTFARRNVMDFDELCVQQHLVPVNLSLAHQATYHELSQHLNSSDMKITKCRKSKDTDRQQQLGDAVEDSQTAEEALSKSAAYPRRAEFQGSSQSMLLNDWISKREGEAQTLKGDLIPMLRKACAKEPVEYFGWREARIDANEIKDKETAAIVRGLCKDVDGGKTFSNIPKSAKTKASTEGAREATSIANKLATRLLTSKRSARYLRSVTRIQGLALGVKDRPRKCDDADCQSELSASDALAVSGLCGHLVCGDCLQRARAKNVAKCAADGCGEAMDGHHLLWSHKLGDITSKKNPPHGAKIEAAMHILGGIRSKHDQAILFVQYDTQLNEVESALAERGISSVVIKSTNDAAKKIADFTNPKSKQTVIVLNATAEAAAGLNLQCASHVIFLSPLLRDTQYAYDSIMAQAIGRVRRHGQKKQIHVYRILALNTIDVDILEHRERRRDALTEQGAPAIHPPPAAEILDMHVQQPQVERTQLVQEKGKFSLRPQSWLMRYGADGEGDDEGEETWKRVKGRRRVGGWEDFSSLVKFSRGLVEDDE